MFVYCCVSIAIGCASSAQRAEAPRPSAERVVAPDLAALTASVRAVSLGESPASHDSLVRALHQLAEHVRALPAAPQAARVRDAADRLATSPATANAHVEYVVRALRSAQQALERQVQKASPEAVASLAALDKALEALAPDRPLAGQQSTVLASLEAATNTLAWLQRQPPPFPESDPTWTPRPPAIALASARELTLEIARADLGKAAPVIARLVDDFASLVHASGGKDDVTRLRFHAQRLAGERPGIREEARWIREALSTALDGLEAGRGVRAIDARAAVANISNARSLVFQRARVQDAVRATLAAFIAAAPSPADTTTTRLP